MGRRLVCAGLLLSCLAAGCGGGLAGLWRGSGEVGDGRFFEMVLDTRDPAKLSATVAYKSGSETRLAVCGLKENEGRLDFVMYPDGKAVSCDAMKTPLKFTGRLGNDVIYGDVLDGAGNRVGMFRAFRAGS